jgi:ring-1,2-phenylacetyl-CoA epoxidase subunit PaaE
MLRFFPLKILNVRAETPTSVSIAFEVPARWKRMYQFKQGQYLTLRATIDRREVRRTYSICSGVDDGELRIAIKQTPGGRFSTHAIGHFRAGQSVDVMPPHGRFFTALDPAAQRRYVLCATGSGITPIISILKTILAVERSSRMVLFYGSRNLDEIMFRDELAQIAASNSNRLEVFHHLSRENPGAPYVAGRLDERIVETARSRMGEPGEWHACFLCGVSEMTTVLARSLETSGVQAERIHVELFKGPAGPLAQGVLTNAISTVIFEGQRFTLALGAGTILEAALEAGVDLPYACRMGSCGSCLGRVMSGKVHMAVNNVLAPEHVQLGYALTCQARSVTPELVIDCDIGDLGSLGREDPVLEVL